MIDNLTLAEVVRRLSEFDDELTIYVLPGVAWTGDVSVRLVATFEEYRYPPEAVGMKYFLEIDIAKEVVEVLQDWLGGQAPTEAQKLAAVIYYAENDAYIEEEEFQDSSRP